MVDSKSFKDAAYLTDLDLEGLLEIYGQGADEKFNHSDEPITAKD